MDFNNVVEVAPSPTVVAFGEEVGNVDVILNKESKVHPEETAVSATSATEDPSKEGFLIASDIIDSTLADMMEEVSHPVISPSKVDISVQTDPLEVPQDQVLGPVGSPGSPGSPGDDPRFSPLDRTFLGAYELQLDNGGTIGSLLALGGAAGSSLGLGGGDDPQHVFTLAIHDIPMYTVVGVAFLLLSVLTSALGFQEWVLRSLTGGTHSTLLQQQQQLGHHHHHPGAPHPVAAVAGGSGLNVSDDCAKDVVDGCFGPDVTLPRDPDDSQLSGVASGLMDSGWLGSGFRNLFTFGFPRTLEGYGLAWLAGHGLIHALHWLHGIWQAFRHNRAGQDHTSSSSDSTAAADQEE